ncbi:MAG: hypothetical protein H6907_09745 [Hyphomicrobiales bacterium]|nr:hypothetical protein [Hyphomicrobiales bacterium]
MVRAIRLLASALLVSAIAGGAAAAEGDQATLEQCAQNYGACMADCASAHPGEPGKPNAAMAACEGGCAGKRAVCEVEAGYDRAKPWVKEKYEKSKKYLQDLWREHMDDKEPAPEPKKGEGKAI